jgi:hypothetical protein
MGSPRLLPKWKVSVSVKPIQAVLLVTLVLSLPACVATKIVTVSVGLAVGLVQVTGKSVVYVGGHSSADHEGRD